MDDRFEKLREATAAALLHGPAATTNDLRVAVAAGMPPPELAALVSKIRTRAYTVTDQDIDALRQSFTEDQLFEIIVAAAFGAAQERLSSALRAVDEA
jgi:alkylhydroperoxidase family enzyme